MNNASKWVNKPKETVVEKPVETEKVVAETPKKGKGRPKKESK